MLLYTNKSLFWLEWLFKLTHEYGFNKTTLCLNALSSPQANTQLFIHSFFIIPSNLLCSFYDPYSILRELPDDWCLFLSKEIAYLLELKLEARKHRRHFNQGPGNEARDGVRIKLPLVQGPSLGEAPSLLRCLLHLHGHVRLLQTEETLIFVLVTSEIGHGVIQEELVPSALRMKGYIPC